MSSYKLLAAASVIVLMVAAVIIHAPRVNGQTPAPAPVLAPAQTPTPAPAPRAERAPFVYRFGAGSEIGVTVRDLDKAGSSSGAVVEEVRHNGPAERAGVKESDVITDFDGERVRSARQFSRLVEETPEGRTVKMTVLRNGQRVAIDVTTEARQFGRVMPISPRIPDLPDMSNFDVQIRPKMEALEKQLRDMPEVRAFSDTYEFGGNGRLGVQVQDLNDQLAEYFGVKHGALVMSVGKDSAAAKAGIKAGDVITSVNGTSVEGTSDVRRALRRVDEGKDFPIEVMRDRKPLSLKGKIEAHERPGTRTEVF